METIQMTPTLDKYKLHPITAECTCSLRGGKLCPTCKAIEVQRKTWETLTPQEINAATKEARAAYPEQF